MCSRPYRTSAATPNTPSAANAAHRSRSCCEGCSRYDRSKTVSIAATPAAKQMRQRQHINKPDVEKPVRRACASALAQNSAMHISGTSRRLPLIVLRTKTIGIDISIKSVRNDASGGSIPSVNLIQSGIGQAPQAAYSARRPPHRGSDARADAAAAHASRRSAAPARQG